jgi:hypothetical protein
LDANMNNELMKLVIPGIILLVWAVTQLFNKENAPPPSPRGPSPGPRPGGLPPAPRPLERTAAGEPTLRFGPSSAPRPAPAPRGDEVLVIREPTRPAPVARRPVRPRAVPPAPPKRPEPAPARSLTTSVSQSLPRDIETSLKIQPLTSTATAASESTKVTAAVGPGTAPSALQLDLRQTLADRNRVREAFILNELLQPPLALRPSRRI